MQKIFLDTNIVVDFLGEREEFYLDAARIMTLADQKKIKIYTSSWSIATTHYILLRYGINETVLEKNQEV